MKEEETMIDSIQDRKQWTDGFIPPQFRGITIDYYAALHQEYGDQVAAARRYVQDTLNGGTRTLVAYGPPNSGKTELASAIWNAVAPRLTDRSAYQDALASGTADNVVFVAGQELPGYWKRAGKADDRKTNSQHIATAWFAVLDDLDKAPAGGWSPELLRLIDTRTWSCQLPTVITMNATPAELAAKHGESGGPILSRFERAGALYLRIGE
jgi:DNA replication protein DnaC